jgi:hypothetical protein
MGKGFGQAHLAYTAGATDQQRMGQSTTLNTAVKAVPESFLPGQWKH